VIAARDGILAALIGIRREALTLEATGRGFAGEPSGQAVEGPEQNHYGQDRKRNLNAAMHSDLG
jgi:hypothetical protein